MLTLHYYSNSESVRAALRQLTAAWWSQDDDPVYSKDLIKEFELENPPLEDELAWILSKGIRLDHYAIIKLWRVSRKNKSYASEIYIKNHEILYYAFILPMLIVQSISVYFERFCTRCQN